MANSLRGPLVYVDSCVYLDLILGRSDRLCPASGRPRDQLALELFEQVRAGIVRLAVSALSDAEVRFHSNDPNAQFVSEVLDGWFRHPATRWTDIDLLLASDASRLHATYAHLAYQPSTALSTADALHLAAAVRLGCEYFVTQDQGFPIGSEVGSSKTMVRFSGPVGQMLL